MAGSATSPPQQHEEALRWWRKPLLMHYRSAVRATTLGKCKSTEYAYSLRE